MNEKTQSDYIKLASNFYKKRLSGQDLTPKKIADALKACAPDYRPAYWRKLRNALAFDQQNKGFGAAAERINKTKNPVTADGSTAAVKPKQKRIKTISAADEKALLDLLVQNKDQESYAAIRVCKALGCRPSELQNIEIMGDSIVIFGSKKSADGKRGADRVLDVSAENFNFIMAAMPKLSKADIGNVQDRIRNAAKKLWPQRLALPTLYTWRHQMGSDLKADKEMNRKSIAYIMGHQSTASVNVYGNKKTGNSARSLPSPAILSADDVAIIREKHSEPPTAMQPVNVNDVKGQSAARKSWGEYESDLGM